MSFFSRSSKRFVKNNALKNVVESSKFDFYETLGVSKNASDQEIKDAYKKSALKYHPDRNLGNEEALESFKKISTAYSVLSDKNKRRQYDMTGGDTAISNFDGFDMSEVSGLSRFFSAVITKIGIPLPTVITPKVLAQARNVCTNASEIAALKPGFPITGSVKNQEAFFFRVQMDEKFAEQGVIIQCRSSTMSKFKLVLFDGEGGVRMLQDSQKRKSCTSAELFFVPFQRVEVSKPSTYSVRIDDKETPMPFYYLDNLETQGSQSLRDGNHIMCIYGDNFYQAVSYRLNFLVLNKHCQPTVTKLSLIEPRLIEKKIQMADFQKEYMVLKKRYEAANNRLKAEDRTICQLLHEREHAYEELFETCLLSNAPVSLSTRKSSGKNWFSSLFS